MKKYEVKINQKEFECEVSASNEDDAIEIALDVRNDWLFERGNNDLDFEVEEIK